MNKFNDIKGYIIRRPSYDMYLDANYIFNKDINKAKIFKTKLGADRKVETLKKRGFNLIIDTVIIKIQIIS